MSFPGQIAAELPVGQPTKHTRPIARPGDLKDASLAPSAKAFSRKALYQVGRSLMSAYASLMLDVDIRCHAPMPQGPKILAPNHPTTTDPLYLLALLPEPVSFLITAALFNVPIVGGYLRAAGHVPAVRRSGGATVDAMVRQVEAGHSVAIFPEGALSPLAGGFHAPHSGVARVALRTGAPVIPIGIGLQRERIRVIETEVDGEKAIGHLYTRGPYAITVGRPQTFRGDFQDHERVRAVASQIMHQIQDLATESERRVRSGRASAASTLSDPTWAASTAGAGTSGKSLPWTK